MTEPAVLYKLMILYMLKKVNYPLSNPQLWTFFEEKGYTNYFTFQETVAALLEANLIVQDEVHQTIRYELTREGEDALYYFANDISSAAKTDMDVFLNENRYQLRNETGITADYYRTTNFDYCVHCVVREGRSNLYELNLSVPTEEQARVLSKNFSDNAQAIYAYIMKRLM